tara:strand:+ start:514 stop:828 length:315 start_codon:yes stop_codon:yes gene_type:complete
MSVEVPQLVGMNGTAFMDGLERVIRTAMDHEVKEVIVKRRHMAAERELHEMGRARSKEGMGELKRIIPGREFFRWAQQFGGTECWGDKQWLREWDRDNSKFKVK